MTTAGPEFDIVIAGGGMTGAMLAQVLLSQLPKLKLAIVELSAEPQPISSSAQPQAPAVSFDSRSIALSAASVELLAQWGLWPELRADACPIRQIVVSDRGHFGKTRLDASEFNRQSLGQVLEIEWLGALLYPKLAKFTTQGRLHWFRPDRIVQLEQQQDVNQLLLQSGRQLQCRLLVVAEGGDSPTRQLAGLPFQTLDYQQSAVIANIGLSQAHQFTAFERFTADGPIALLPLSRQRYSLVWTSTAAQTAELMTLSDPDFLALLQQEFGYRAGVFQSVGQRQRYPLLLKFSEQGAAARLLLCGNSLHNLHPIAGQGFNLALRDIAAISQLVAMSAQDPGRYAVTRAYQQLRQPDVQQVIRFTDGLVRLFSNQSRLLALGRNLGLSALMACPMLKTSFARQSMGLSPMQRQQQQLAELLSAAQLSAAQHQVE